MQTLFYLLCLYSCAVKCTAMSMDCPTYFREPFEPFDQQKWDAMAACAKDKTRCRACGLPELPPKLVQGSTRPVRLAPFITVARRMFQTRLQTDYRPIELQEAIMEGSRRSAGTQRSKLRSATVPNGMPIPKEFDLRTEHPACADIIGHITDQGHCANCWAHAAAGVMSDRICIASNGAYRVHLSVYDLTACCWECNMGLNATYKCQYGSEQAAFEYWVNVGVVTEQCKPVDSSTPWYTDPQCLDSCDDGRDIEQSRYYGMAGACLNRT